MEKAGEDIKTHEESPIGGSCGAGFGLGFGLQNVEYRVNAGGGITLGDDGFRSFFQTANNVRGGVMMFACKDDGAEGTGVVRREILRLMLLQETDGHEDLGLNLLVNSGACTAGS